MMAMICLLVWGWGMDMYLWAKYRVNYVFIFEFDPRRHHRYTTIFEVNIHIIYESYKQSKCTMLL